MPPQKKFLFVCFVFLFVFACLFPKQRFWFAILSSLHPQPYLSLGVLRWLYRQLVNKETIKARYITLQLQSDNVNVNNVSKIV